MSSNLVNIDEEFVKKIKAKRRQKNFTQSDVAELLGISSKKYSRIETLTQTMIETKIYNRLLAIFEIEDYDPKDNNSIRFTMYIPVEWRNNLEQIQEEKGYSSLNETVKRCLEDVLYYHHLKKVETILTENIRDLIRNTYQEEMDKMALRMSINEIVLKRILGNDEEQYEEIIERCQEDISKIMRAKQY